MFFLWNPESRKILLLESEMLGFGIRNTGQGVRSPSNDWNPESKTGIKYLKSGIHGVEARIQDCLAWINRVEIRLLDSLNSIRVLHAQCMYCLFYNILSGHQFLYQNIPYEYYAMHKSVYMYVSYTYSLGIAIYF